MEGLGQNTNMRALVSKWRESSRFSDVSDWPIKKYHPDLQRLKDFTRQLVRFYSVNNILIFLNDYDHLPKLRLVKIFINFNEAPEHNL